MSLDVASLSTDKFYALLNTLAQKKSTGLNFSDFFVLFRSALVRLSATRQNYLLTQPIIDLTKIFNLIQEKTEDNTLPEKESRELFSILKGYPRLAKVLAPFVNSVIEHNSHYMFSILMDSPASIGSCYQALWKHATVRQLEIAFDSHFFRKLFLTKNLDYDSLLGFYNAIRKDHPRILSLYQQTFYQIAAEYSKRKANLSMEFASYFICQMFKDESFRNNAEPSLTVLLNWVLADAPHLLSPFLQIWLWITPSELLFPQTGLLIGHLSTNETLYKTLENYLLHPVIGRANEKVLSFLLSQERLLPFNLKDLLARTSTVIKKDNQKFARNLPSKFTLSDRRFLPTHLDADQLALLRYLEVNSKSEISLKEVKANFTDSPTILSLLLQATRNENILTKEMILTYHPVQLNFNIISYVKQNWFAYSGIWRGAQRIFHGKEENESHIFGLAIPWAKGFISQLQSAGVDNESISRLNRLRLATPHPAPIQYTSRYKSRESLGLGWVRYTKLDNNEIWIEEIQTDLAHRTKDKEGNYQYDFGKEMTLLFKNIVEDILLEFIRVFRRTGHSRFYLPGYEMKTNEKYYPGIAPNPPLFLYKDLPRKLRFKQTTIEKIDLSLKIDDPITHVINPKDKLWVLASSLPVWISLKGKNCEDVSGT